MLYSKNYKTSTIEASKKSLEGLMELHQEIVGALDLLQIIIEGHDTPLDPQTLAELKSLYSTAHLMLTKETAQVCHIEAMQQARQTAQEIFGEMKATRKSNKPTQATA